MKTMLFGATALALVAGFSGVALSQTSTTTTVQPGMSGVINPGVVGDGANIQSGIGSPVVASSCSQSSLAAAQDMVSSAPASVRSDLAQKLHQAGQLADENEYQQCAQELAEIEAISQGSVGTSNMAPVTGTGTTGVPDNTLGGTGSTTNPATGTGNAPSQ